MSTVKANTLEPASGGTIIITGAALTTPALGTPASGNLANCTGLPASSVVNTPSGGISATTVQAALNELDTAVAACLPKSGGTMTDNLAFANGKGIDFSATPGTGDSELLDDYEEGTWTPVDESGAGLVYTSPFGAYTKVGDTVTAWGRVTYPVTASVLTICIGGLPFVVASNSQPGGGFIRLTNSGRSDTVVASAGSSQLSLYANNINAAVNVNYSTFRVDFVVIYKV